MTAAAGAHRIVLTFMADNLPPILSNPAVAARTSEATRQVLRQRALPPAPAHVFTDEQRNLLRQIVDTLLPQTAIGTGVDLAGTIEQQLEAGGGLGWRYAVLPHGSAAYIQGLDRFAAMLQQTPMKTFAAMPVPAREGYLRCVANGDVDGPADFPLSRWLETLRVDAMAAWMAHPSTMQAIGYFGFADGATGNEGWQAMTPNTALPFEHGIRDEEQEKEVRP